MTTAVTSTATADTAPQNPNDPTTPVTVSDDALPAPQINGVVWATAIADNVVYAGGNFTNARPAGSAPGQNTVTRSNFLAFNVNTGQLFTSVAPAFNGQVRSLSVSPDKTRLYVSGEFTTAAGQTRRRIAAFAINNNNANSPQLTLVSGFAPSVNGDVDAVVATNSKVYAGGSFLGVGNATRQNLAAFQASNGALLDWAPQATGGTVSALTINPDGTKVAIGGGFTALNGSSNPGYGLGMVDATSGTSFAFAVNNFVRNGTVDGAIDTLTTDGTYIYGGGWTFGRVGGTWEGIFAASWDAGEVRWLDDCHGDMYSVFATAKVVYGASHTHYCENIDGVRQGAGGVGDYPYHRGIALGKEPTGTVTWEPDQGRYFNFVGQPASSWLGWYPEINTGTFTGQSQGSWSVTANADYVVFGGEFTRVNGTNQQGLVRFPVSGKAANDEGPNLFNASYPLNVTSTEAGSVRVNWGTNNDNDNEYLTYRVYRDTQNAAGLIHTTNLAARYWAPYTRGITDTGLAPGSTHQYRVVVTDPFGNVANSPWTSITVAASGTDSDYVKAVYDSQPTDYWRLGDAVGTTTSADTVGQQPLTASGVAAFTRSTTPGAISDDSNGFTTFNGTNTGWTATGVQANPPEVFSLELWFRSNAATVGGRLAGWSARNTQGNSQKHDRQLYMNSAGQISFGTRPTNQRLVATSPNSYRDGQWHQAVGTLSKAGLKLFVDGDQVAARTDVTTAEHLALGYWRIGGDTVSGWPLAPTSGFFNGDLDDVAVYNHEISPVEVAAHYAAGKATPLPNVKPFATFTATVDGLSADVDASGSSDPDGTIASYAWTFGDGGTATGVHPTPPHVYAAGGTYGVTLTVTDDEGATNSVTKLVKVTAKPTADFTTTVTGNKLDVNGSGSSDSDGTIASYAWTFGDGGTATGAIAAHNYASGGTFNVKLTVTDNDGATNSLTKPVTVVAPNASPTASFSTSTNSLLLTVNGSGSSDPDGTIVDYAWTFGDGATASGATPDPHPYAAAGTYNVTLKVTDNGGATNSLTRPVTVSVAPPAFALDSFTRTVTGNWGDAETGGAWTRSGTATNYSVTGGQGTIRMGSAGSGPGISLNGVSSSNTDLRVSIGLDKAATGGGTYITVKPRVMTNGDHYYVDTHYLSDGTVQLVLGRIVGSTETVLRTVTVPGLGAATNRLVVRAQAFPTPGNPASTTLQAKLWRADGSEPSAWTSTMTDSTAALQGAGAIGLATYLSGSSTNAPQVASFDDLRAGPTG